MDIHREIAGSVEYINRTLAPEKKHTRIFFWTGDGLADGEALALTRLLGLENMNGGGATISDAERTMTRVPPLGYKINDHVQVYAPIASEHFYTNNWQGPFYGFNRVIETMRLTDSPRRLKPMHIHYHFYSGSKIASVNALKSVYDWSLTQEHRAIWVSEYGKKVNEFHNATLSRRTGWGLGYQRIEYVAHLTFADLVKMARSGKVKRGSGISRYASRALSASRARSWSSAAVYDAEAALIALSVAQQWVYRGMADDR